MHVVDNRILVDILPIKLLVGTKSNGMNTCANNVTLFPALGFRVVIPAVVGG